MTAKSTLPTDFAPAERATEETVHQQFKQIHSLPFVKEFLDAIPNMSVVLNHERQIVYANRAFLEFLGEPDFNELLGKKHGEALNCIRPTSPIGLRPGEAVQCVHAGETEGGCGTSLFCRTCGAIRSILQSQKTHDLSIEECRMIRCVDEKNQALDLRVWSRPIEVGEDTYTVFSVLDISDEKRRRLLERIFFHDLLNTAGGMQGLAGIIASTDLKDDQLNEIADLLHGASGDLIEEINSQRTLSAAETGELTLAPTLLNTLELLHSICSQTEKYEVARKKHVVIAPEVMITEFHCDHHLIRRVLINLVKNALEASEDGETVTLNCRQTDRNIEFTVHNETVMPLNVQLQIFNRSFSTKGENRGIGTYSIKLLTERYMNGKVSFISATETGTIFKIILPRALTASEA